MSNSTVSLLRANVALTTNYKIVVDSKYNLYLESYNSNQELSDRKYKKFMISPDSFISERISKFYKDLPADIAFDVKNTIKSDNIQSIYKNQYDDIYYSGPRNVEDNSFVEEFQYHTTLKINPRSLPKYFFIFRVNDTGLLELTKDNVKDKFLGDLKIIQTFDLSPKTNIGKLWKKNYIDDDKIPISPFELNSNKYEFSTWNGYDYKSGGTVSKSFFLDDFLQNQTTDFEFESFLTDGFRKNEVVSSNYTNISYLYDDTVCGIFIKGFPYLEEEYPFIFKLIKDKKIDVSMFNRTINVSGKTVYIFNTNIPYRKKWTINRYSGFYIDNILALDKISSYANAQFSTDPNIQIQNNVFVIPDVDNPGEFISISPLLGAFNENLPIYFKIENDFYLVEKQGNKYVIISDKIFNGYMNDFLLASSKSIKIVFDDPNVGTYKNYIKYLDDSYYYNDKFSKYEDGIIVIKMFDQFYTLNIDNVNKRIYINTDELIYCDTNILTRQLGENTRYNNLQILTKDNVIDYFDIYVLQFTDIKDFDFKRTDTDHTRIEYDKNNSVSYNRPFFYQLDSTDVSFPIDVYYEKDYKIHIHDVATDINSLVLQGQYILPTSSEYASSGDLYVITDTNKLTRIWDLNQSVVKFGYSNSIGSNSAAYKLNNSLDVWSSFNMTSNMYGANISTQDLNLDYFYTFGRPINYQLDNFYTLVQFNNYIDENIIHRTLNIDTEVVETDPNWDDDSSNMLKNYYSPNLEEYKNPTSNFDYFDYLLNTPYRIDYQDHTKNIYKKVNRIAYLNECDGVNGPSLFFKGFNAYLQYVKLENPNDVNSFKTVTSADDLVDYGFSIVFYGKFTSDETKFGKAGIDVMINKIHKNILIHIYIYIASYSYTSLDYRNRDFIYNEEYVKYGYQDFSGLITFIDSELAIKDLTLNKLINIISTCQIENDSFSDGIHYEIIDNYTQYRVTNAVLDPLDLSNKTIIVTFDKAPNLKEHDWMKFHNTTIPEFDQNVQIVSKVNNLTYKFTLIEDATANLVIINPLLDQITVTNEISVLPFRFKIIEPNEIKLNTNVNLIVGDNSCPVKPFNNIIVNKDILLQDDSLTGLVPNVYNNDNISRRIFKKNNEAALTYSAVQNLPSIFRFNGHYEPIVTDIELFNSEKLIKNSTGYVGLRYVKFILNTELLKYNLVIGIEEDPFNIIQPIEIDDIIYIKKSNNGNESYLNTTSYVVDIYDSVIQNGSREIKLSILFDQEYINDFNVSNPGGILFYDFPYIFDIKLFKRVEKNTLFNYNFLNFGINKNIIISKVQGTINIMKTSAATYNQTNRFPMIDEHGVTVIDRNVFKSSWDLDYYYTQINNKYDIL